jgi:pimeloyl-ACP methyl ester carboxylesterase
MCSDAFIVHLKGDSMFATPAAILGVWFRGLLAIAILVGGSWLLWKWYDEVSRPKQVIAVDEDRDGEEEGRIAHNEGLADWRPGLDRETALLAGGLMLITWGLAGRLLSPRLFRRRDSNGTPEMRGGHTESLNSHDGTKLHVEVHGDEARPTLILLHGWGLDHTVWSYLKRDVAGPMRLVVWDLPGIGHSARAANGDYSLERMAGDLRRIVDRYATDKPVVLVGHSIGGMIILTFCRLFPELLGDRVSKLALIHTTYTNPLKTMPLAKLLCALQKPVIEPLLYLQIALFPLVWLMNWLSYINGSSHISTARSDFAGTESRNKLDFLAGFSPKHAPDVLARGGLAMLHYDATAVLPSIRIPVLVISGDRDPVTLPSASEFIESVVQKPARHELAPAKHCGMIEHEATFAQKLKEFCEARANRVEQQAG